MRLKGNNSAEGNYTFTITGTGPNGTPIHKRTITVSVSAPLPVQLASFTASVVNRNQVRLRWLTISETNNYGFEVQKSLTREDNYQTIPNSFIVGHGTTLEPHYYSFTDTETEQGIWFYRLKQIDLDGTVHYTDAIQVSVVTDVASQASASPRSFALEQNYPNPFNPTTEIRYQISEVSHVTLNVFDLMGRKVATLVNEVKAAGEYKVEFDARDLSSGVYFYRLTAGNNNRTKRMVLIK